MTTTNKSAVSSIGVWGSLAGIATGLTSLLTSGVIPGPWVPYVTLVSGFIALVGRVRAKGKITGVLTK